MSARDGVSYVGESWTHGPVNGGMMTDHEEAVLEAAHALAERLIAQHDGDVVAAYLRIGGGFEAESAAVLDAADEMLWERMDEGQRMLTGAPNAPDDLVASMAAHFAWKTRPVQPEYAEEVAA